MTSRDPEAGDEGRYWDAIGKEWGRDRPPRLWRAHSDAVNRKLLAAWLPPSQQGRLLKTDGFDEAVAEGVVEMLLTRCRRLTVIDLARETLREVKEAMGLNYV